MFRTHSLIVILFAAALGFTPISSAIAGPVEDAAAKTQRARLQLTRAMNDSRQADDDLRKINDTLDNAQARQRSLNQQLDQQKRQRQDIVDRSNAAAAALPSLQSTLAAAQKISDAAAVPLNSARKQHDADLAELARVRALADDAFHLTDSYLQAKAEVDASASAIDAATIVCINKLEASAEYRSALQAYESAVRDLDKSKKNLPPGHPRIVADSKTMIETDSTVRSMRNDALTHDQAIIDAKQRAAKAGSALASLIAAYEKRVVLQPDMVTASATADKSKMLVLVADAKFKQADADRADADAKLKSARADIDNAKTNLAKLDASITSTQSDLTQASRAYDDANRRLPTAQRASRDAAQRVTDAQRIYDQAVADERRIRNQQNN